MNLNSVSNRLNSLKSNIDDIDDTDILEESLSELEEMLTTLRKTVIQFVASSEINSEGDVLISPDSYYATKAEREICNIEQSISRL